MHTDHEHLDAIREGVRSLCRGFDEQYWLQLDREQAYPTTFVKALTEAGYLGALIPEEYGGAGLGVSEGAAILEEISRSGGHPGACHAQMYVMGAVLRHGSATQKQRYLQRSPAENCDYNPSGSPNPAAAPIPPA